MTFNAGALLAPRSDYGDKYIVAPTRTHFSLDGMWGDRARQRGWTGHGAEGIRAEKLGGAERLHRFL